MYKTQYRLASLLLAGAMTIGTATCAYADEAAGPGAKVTEAAAENTASETSGYVTAPDHTVVTGIAPGDSGSADTSGSTGTGTGTSTGTTAGSADASVGGEALNQQAASELEAEAAAAAATAAAENAGPLTVPARFPRVQATTFLAQEGKWSFPYINEQWVDEGQPFASVSIFLTEIIGNIHYRCYTSQYGWTDWAMNGQATTMHEAAVEAIQLRISGPAFNDYDIYYDAKLEDGTQTGFAKNSETAGTMNQSHYMTGFRMFCVPKGSAAPGSTEKRVVAASADGPQIVDGALRYINGADGSSFTGWGWVDNQRYYFHDSYPVTGWQYIDGYKYYFAEDGRMLSDLEPIVGNGGPFLIKINKEMNCMTIYTKDGDNGYIIPVKTFLLSTGDDTPVGTFKTPEKYRWRLMNSGVYAQYATRLGSGLSYLMHSIIYDRADAYSVWASTFNALGIARSAGCIRLLSSDCKWIYDHCPVGTTVVVYNSSIPGPYERPSIPYEIPFEQTWDPTDPNVTQEGIAAATARILANYGQ